jgi:lysophospholipase L1-like esterase
MRRFWFWYLPLVAAIVFSGVFAYGFYAGLRGGAGKPLGAVVPTSTASAQLRRGPLSILVLGDSLARGAGDATGLGIGGRLDAELKSMKVAHSAPVNLAVNGSRTANLLEQLAGNNVRRIVGQSNVIVLSIGGNDLWGTAAALNPQRQPVPNDPDALLNDVEARVAKVVAELRSANPSARIFYVGLYDPFANRPFGAITSRAVTEWNSRLMRRFAADRNFNVVQTFDLFSAHEERLSVDHFHPGAAGYTLIARRIAEAI